MKFSRNTFLVVIIISLTSNLFAQVPDTLWTRTYGGSDSDGSYSVEQTPDGGYIIAGQTWSFGAGLYDFWLLKLDSLGDTLWTYTYGGSGHDLDRSVQLTSDGGYILAGSSNSFGAGDFDIYLVKTDSLGHVLWTRTYGGGENDYGWCVCQASDGGYIIAAETHSFGAGLSDLYLVKTEANGDTVWTRTYGGIWWDWGDFVEQTSDGGYIITGGTHIIGQNTADVYLLKIDSLGDTLWTRIYGGGWWDWGECVQQTSDEGYIITGYTSSFGAGLSDIYLLKTDSLGDLLWTRTYGGTNRDYGYSVRQTSDEGYIIAGWTASFGPGAEDVYLVKIDSLGDTLWTRTYGGGGADGSWCIQKTSDGGYIIVGLTTSFGAGSDDVYIIKIEPDVGVKEEISEKVSKIRIPGLVYGDVLELTGLNRHTEVKIFDILGREVLNKKISPLKSYIKVNKLAAGVYFLSFEAEKLKSNKFILIK